MCLGWLVPGEYLADKLAAAGMPAAFIAGGQPQAERMATLSAIRGFRLRVIVSTDLVKPCDCRLVIALKEK